MPVRVTGPRLVVPKRKVCDTEEYGEECFETGRYPYDSRTAVMQAEYFDAAVVVLLDVLAKGH